MRWSARSLALTLCVVCCTASLPRAGYAAEAAAVRFRAYDLRLTHPVRQEVFALPLADRAGPSLVVAGVSGEGVATLSVFTPDADGSLPPEPTRRRRLPAEVVALDADHESLYLLTPEAVWRWEAETDSFRTLVEVRSLFQARPAAELVPYRFVRDADGDGDTDLVVPDFRGYRVFRQDPRGTFSESASLELPPIAHHQEYNDRITYRAVALHFADVDGDGKRDALAIRGDSIRVFRGDGSGGFEPARASALGLGVTEGFLGDDVGDIDVDHTDRTWKRVVAARDFDRDGVVDLFSHTIRSKGLFEKNHSFELNRGRRRDGSLEVVQGALPPVESAPIVDDPTFADVDGDGRLDFSTWSVEIGLGTILGWLVTGKIELQVSLFRLGPDGSFPATPTRREDVEVAFDLKSGKPTVPPAFLADVDGDARQDLVLGTGTTKLEIFRGDGSAKLFADEPVAIEIALPGNGRDLVGALDVNRDGKDDLVVRYGRVDGEERSRTMKVLIAE